MWRPHFELLSNIRGAFAKTPSFLYFIKLQVFEIFTEKHIYTITMN